MEPSTRHSLILWSTATLITLSSVVFQRMTGPTYPKQGTFFTESGESIAWSLPTSHESGHDAKITIHASGIVDSGYNEMRRVNSSDEWTRVSLIDSGETLIGSIPSQPPAGKMAYTVTLIDGGQELALTTTPVIIRFKGAVPGYVLIPHIFCMFAAMLLAARTGLGALTANGLVTSQIYMTAVLLFIGGLILGPIVQKYAFGAFWTGWPSGHDLTDNKTALAMIVWIVAIWRHRKTGSGRWWIFGAVMVHFLVYLVPHSLMGSELTYE